MTWLILREPGKVPERKGPFPHRTLRKTLREFMAARPSAFITVVEIHGTEISVEDGPQCLEVLDGRSASTAAAHRESTRKAFAERAVR